MQREPVIIPPDSLSPEALYGVIERFILREGTDYGQREIDLSTKISSVKRQIDAGMAYIVFDPETETATVLSAHDPALKRYVPAQKG
jgi:hypothetical protein